MKQMTCTDVVCFTRETRSPPHEGDAPSNRALPAYSPLPSSLWGSAEGILLLRQRRQRNSASTPFNSLYFYTPEEKDGASRPFHMGD